MKKIIYLALVVFSSARIAAQDTTIMSGPWKFNGLTSINFSQVDLTNWSQGGDNSVAFNALGSFNMDYTEDKTTWSNMLDIGYGIQKIGEKDPGKTDDHIDILSKYGRKAKNNWYISGSFNLKTQFARGYKTGDAGKVLISDFMSPGYITLAIGLEYKPNESFFVSLSPVSGKITIVLNDSLSTAGSFGVDPGKSTRGEFGGSARIGLNKEILKNVTLTTSLDIFSNYVENPQNIDISWKALVNMKINEYLSANISTHLMYDDDIEFVDDTGATLGPRIQFKELFGIGLSFKF